MIAPATPNPIDLYVGHEITRLRKKRGLTLAALADSVGVTFQQLRKYENAENRVSASRLAAISVALGVTIERFFPLDYTRGRKKKCSA